MWPEECSRLVFLVTRTPTMDGVNTVLRTLTAEFTRRGVQVEFISIWPGSGEPLGPTFTVDVRESWHRGPVFRGSPVDWRRLSRLPIVGLKRVDRWLSNRAVLRRLRAFGPETVMVFTNVRAKTRLDQAGLRRNSAGPLWVGQHHSSSASVEASPAALEETQRHFSDIDLFIALTPEDARGFSAMLPGVRCAAVGNPLPIGSFPESTRQPIAIALSRFSPEKRLDVMISAFLEATDVPDLKHWQLHLYGEGYDEQRLRGIVTDSESAGRVSIRGRVDDVGRVTSSASVHLLTSEFEGWGMCIVEAAQSAVPTIAYDCAPGVRELVAAGCGTLVRSGDKEGLVTAIRRSLRDPEGLHLQGKRARDHVAQYSAERIGDEWARLIRESLNVRRS